MDFFSMLKGGTILGKRKYSTPHGDFKERDTSVLSKVEQFSKPTPQSKVKVDGLANFVLQELVGFTDERIPDWLQKGITQSGYIVPTAIQSQAFPVMNAGYDLVASASTGSGKTLGFLIPMLSVLERPGKDFARGLIVACTRELAQQITREANHLMSNCSKKFRVRIIDNLASNVKRIDIAICTPLRLVQLIKDGSVSLSATRIAVFDEADKLLDMGFSVQIDEIISNCLQQRNENKKLQLCFFSATLPPKIVSLAKTAMIDPVTIHIGTGQASACPNIEQSLMFAGSEEGKILSFKQLVISGQLIPPAIVFVNSKEKAKQLCDELLLRGVLADSIHADKSKSERDRCVCAFREGKIWVLVATDVLARGLDFKAVQMVINYDIPTTAVNYIHRIGRTGRAGRHGKAITFFTIDDKIHLRTIANVITNSGQEVPEWMLQVSKKRVSFQNKHKRVKNIK